MLKQTILTLAPLCLAVTTFGQNAATEQVRSRTQAITPEDSGELRMITEDRGEVVELGGKSARIPRFRTAFSTSIEYQSNAPLLPSGPRNDWVSVSSVEAVMERPLGDKFGFELDTRADVLRYFHIPNISYWGPLGTGLFYYRPHPGGPRLYAGGQLYHYDFIDRPGKITEAGAVLAGLIQNWTFQGGKAGISAGYQFGRYWASPKVEDRMSHTLFASYTQQLLPSLFAQTGYYWQYTDFESFARRDSRHLVGVALVYAPKDKFSMRLFANYVRNESSFPLTDYENFTSGLGASFILQF